MDNIKVTSFEDLKRYANGNLVELPPFGDGQPFVAKIKRPSMLAMVKSGKIPNALLTTANELFAGNSGSVIDTEDTEAMDNLFSILDILCDACFVEPKYKDIREAGLELTDDQFMFIFSYTQQGVKALDSFRSKRENNISNINVADVSENTVGASLS